MRHLFLIAATLTALHATTPATAAETGWETLAIQATGSYCSRYIPESLDQNRSAPAIIFLHGSGAYPHNYHSYLEAAAEETGAVLILPKSIRYEGWGDSNDQRTIAESLNIVGEEIRINAQRISVAGHSSGGAYGIRLVYLSAHTYSAIFTMAAPFIGVVSINDAKYTAPIFMYWGFDDPNFLGGASESYDAQWQRLNVEWILEVLLGYGHNDLPPEIVSAGFTFLVEHKRPPPPRPWRKGTSTRVRPSRLP